MKRDVEGELKKALADVLIRETCRGEPELPSTLALGK